MCGNLGVGAYQRETNKLLPREFSSRSLQGTIRRQKRLPFPKNVEELEIHQRAHINNMAHRLEHERRTRTKNKSSSASHLQTRTQGRSHRR